MLDNVFVLSAPPVNEHAASTEGRLAFLDYLRIFAFASVFAGHKFSERIQASANGTGLESWIARMATPFTVGGGVGVVVFFLVSGYIITHVLQREQTAAFLVKRALRIYPLYVTTLLALYGFVFVQHGLWPPAGTLLPQLLLIGDLTATRYALIGAEWTLRLEVSFYLLMAACASAGLMRSTRGRVLSAVFGALIVLLHILPPFPTHTRWALGYLSLYLPFLLLGSIWWLFERHLVKGATLVVYIVTVLLLYRLGLEAWQPRWQNMWFPELALMLFALAWALRHNLPAPAWVLGLAELTYAVYLLHGWLFDIFRNGLLAVGIGRDGADVAGVVGVLAVSWVLVRLIERPGIRLGRKLARLITHPAQARV